MMPLRVFYWYHPKIRKLENTIRRKRKSRDLPYVNIVIKKFIEKDPFLMQQDFLQEEFDQEKKIFQTFKTLER